MLSIISVFSQQHAMCTKAHVLLQSQTIYISNGPYTLFLMQFIIWWDWGRQLFYKPSCKNVCKDLIRWKSSIAKSHSGIVLARKRLYWKKENNTVLKVQFIFSNNFLRQRPKKTFDTIQTLWNILPWEGRHSSGLLKGSKHVSVALHGEPKGVCSSGVG